MKWFADRSAQIAHARLREALQPFVTEMFPAYELSHAGINRNEVTQEVVIKLHLNQIGKIKVLSDPLKLPGVLG